MSKSTDTAKQVLSVARELGWAVSVSRTVLTIEKRIALHDNDSFVQADMEYFSILELVPMTSPGSIWGTDGSGVGGVAAMSSGVFRMNKSGCSKRVLNAIAKEMKK